MSLRRHVAGCSRSIGKSPARHHDQYGLTGRDGASLHAANLAGELLDKGDLDGRALWLRIHEAVLELGREALGEGEARH